MPDEEGTYQKLCYRWQEAPTLESHHVLPCRGRHTGICCLSAPVHQPHSRWHDKTSPMMQRMVCTTCQIGLTAFCTAAAPSLPVPSASSMHVEH